MRPPHLRQTVTSTAKTRARSFAQQGPTWPRRGVGRRAGGVVRGGGEVERELELGHRGGGWDDAGAEVVMAREHPEVAEHVKARRRHERAEAGEELVRGHVGVGDAAAPRSLEEDADPAVGQRLDGVMGEGRPQHVAAHPLELLAVAAVDGGRGVQVHAERGERQRRPRRGLLRWERVRAGERELHAGGEGGVQVQGVVVVLGVGGGGDGLVDLRERGRHALRCRRPRGQEAQAFASLLEGAIRDETVQMHVEAEVAAEALHRREHPCVQRLHRSEAVARQRALVNPRTDLQRERQGAAERGQPPRSAATCAARSSRSATR
jgi:hypothetical protein